MASETVDHSNISQQGEKEVLEEVKTMEENVPLQPKATEEKPKELEEVSIPLAETEVEEKPKSEEPIVAAEEKVDDKQIEIHEAEEIKKPDIHVPSVVDEPKDSLTVTDVVINGDQPEKPQEELVKESGVDDQELPEKSEVLDVSPPAAEVVPEKTEVPASVTEVTVDKEEEKTDIQESGTKEEPDESTTESVDVKELIIKTEIPESLIAESKEVEAEELSSKESETEVVKDVEVPSAEVIKEAAPEPEPEDEKEEKPEIAATVEEKPDENLAVETKNDDSEIPSDEIKGATVEPVISDSSDQVTSIPEEIHVAEKNVEVPPPLEGAEKTIVEDEEKEVAVFEKEGATVEPVKVEEKIEKEDKAAVFEESALPEDVPSTLSQEAGKIIDQTSREIELPAENGSKNDESTKEEVEIEKKMDVLDLLQKTEPETKTEEPVESKVEQEEKEVKEPANAKTDDPIEKEDKAAVSEESALPEDVPSTLSQEAEKIIEQTSREIELPAENGDKNDESTKEEVDIEKKMDVLDYLQENEPETKTEEPVESKVEQEEKEVKEPEKTDAPIEEPTKDTEELKTVQEVPKKQSNNLLAKMKHSLVKAKKAITGKSQSKTPSSEIKDEVKAT